MMVTTGIWMWPLLRIDPYNRIKEWVTVENIKESSSKISCGSSGHREAKPHGKELLRRWLRLAKK
jgi:hypothetical protein